MRHLCALLLVSVVAACGADKPPVAPRVTVVVPDKEAPEVEFDVQVRGHRQGNALHLDVFGTATNSVAGTAFEQPDSWTVDATSAGGSLKRILNGSRRVDRIPAGEFDSGRWDVNIQFTVAFEMPEGASNAKISIAPPTGKKETFVLEGLVAPKKTAANTRSRDRRRHRRSRSM